MPCTDVGAMGIVVVFNQPFTHNSYLLPQHSRLMEIRWMLIAHICCVLAYFIDFIRLSWYPEIWWECEICPWFSSFLFAQCISCVSRFSVLSIRWFAHSLTHLIIIRMRTNGWKTQTNKSEIDLTNWWCEMKWTKREPRRKPEKAINSF